MTDVTLLVTVIRNIHATRRASRIRAVARLLMPCCL
jgi:hypothetical protein